MIKLDIIPTWVYWAAIGVLAATVGVQQVSVFSEPPGAMLSIDERPLGLTPLTLELNPGQHRTEQSTAFTRDATRAHLNLYVEPEPAANPYFP